MAKKNSIDEMLLELEVTPSNKTGIDLKKDFDLDVSSREDLAEELMKVTKEDRKMADKLFELFYPEIMHGRDRSQASKEALSKALELKITAGKNIIDLLKIMKQDEKNTNAIGVFFNEKNAGISLSKIQDSFDDDE